MRGGNEPAERVAQRYAFFAFLCGSSPYSSSGINMYVDIFIFRTAEEFVSEPNTSALPAGYVFVIMLRTAEEVVSEPNTSARFYSFTWASG